MLQSGVASGSPRSALDQLGVGQLDRVSLVKVDVRNAGLGVAAQRKSGSGDFLVSQALEAPLAVVLNQAWASALSRLNRYLSSQVGY